MNYCDSDRYMDYGGPLDEDDYRTRLWLERASRVIDRITLGRAAVYAEDLEEELADACARIADLLAGQAEALETSRGGALSGFSNDGYSESYSADGLSGSRFEAQARAILADSLGEDRYGLLWRGL